MANACLTSFFFFFFNCLEFYPGWSWWRPRSRMCWRNVHSAYTCKTAAGQFDLATTLLKYVNTGRTGNTNTSCCLTWTSRGCSRPGLWSWCRFQPFQRRPSPVSGRTCVAEMQSDESLFLTVCARVTRQMEKLIGGQPTWPSLGFRPVCLCAPALWSRQRCSLWGWYWWVSPAKLQQNLPLKPDVI